MSQPQEDKLRDAVDNERLRASLIETIEELVDDAALERVAYLLHQLADQVFNAKSTVEDWTVAEDRESKAETKETALEHIGYLLDTIDDLRDHGIELESIHIPRDDAAPVDDGELRQRNLEYVGKMSAEALRQTGATGDPVLDDAIQTRLAELGEP